MKLEAKIGLFVVLGLAALFLLSTQVTNLGKWNEEGYVIYAAVDDATGLEMQTHVAMNGVGIGEISGITIENRKVKLALMIDKGVQIPEDSMISITQESVLGAKRVNIIAGQSDVYITASGMLDNYKQYAPFDQTSDSINSAALEIQQLMKDVREVLDEQRKEELRELITAFREVGVNLNAVIAENREALKSAVVNIDKMGAGFSQTAETVNKDLPQIMTQINSLTRQLDELGSALNDKLPGAVDRFVAIEDNISSILQENKGSLKNALTSADAFFASGQDAFDKVDSMLSNFTVSELQIGARADYMVNDDAMRTMMMLAYLPNPETYYLIDLVSMDDYSRIGIEPTLHEEGVDYLSAQYGKRFDNLLLRAGLIESTGGFGFDYFADHDRLKTSFDAFDFNAVNDVRGEEAHLRLGVRYQFLKHLEVYGGWDNFLNSDADNLYFGVGMKFIDNNLKYVLSGASMGM